MGSTSTSNDIKLEDKPLIEFNARINNDGIGTFVQNRILFGWKNFTNFEMVLNSEGNLGLGTTIPKSKLQISDGDVYIENINNGIIMRSPDGQCWRLKIANSGQLEPTAINCPN